MDVVAEAGARLSWRGGHKHHLCVGGVRPVDGMWVWGEGRGEEAGAWSIPSSSSVREDFGQRDRRGAAGGRRKPGEDL